MNAVKEFQRRRKKRLEKRMRSARTEDEMMRVAYALYRTYHEDGGPGSGNHNHAGRPGERGGSAPTGGADSTATKAKYDSFKECYEKNFKPDAKCKYLSATGVIPKAEAEDLSYAIENGTKEESDTAQEKLKEYESKYFDALEKGYEPKPLSTEKHDEFMAMDSDEKMDFCNDSMDRELTDSEYEWANRDSDFQKVAIDTGLTGTPQIVCGEDFDKFVSDNDAQVIYRGVNDIPQMTASNMVYEMAYEEDKPYVGHGLYGDGLYFSDKGTTADWYGEMGKSVTCALRPDAKIVDYFPPAPKPWEKNEPREIDTIFYDYNKNESAAATALGYDAIRVKIPQNKGEVYYCVLNKSALIMKDPMEGAMNQALEAYSKN